MSELAAENNPPCHLVTIEQVYYQMPYEEPEGIDSRSSHMVFSEEEPFIKRKTLSNNWEKLPTGSIQGQGTVVIQNKVQHPSQIPTPEQKLELENRIIEVSWGIEIDNQIALIIRPGHTCRFEAFDLSEIYLRSKNAPLSCRIYVFPS